MAFAMSHSSSFAGCPVLDQAPAAPARGASRRPVRVVAESMTSAYARIKAQRKKSKEKYEREQQLEKFGGAGKFFGSVIGALDFQEDIAEDRGLLAAARRLGRGERMSDASAGALKRKIGGTKGGFFGETVELKGKYAERGYVPGEEDEQQADVPLAPVLAATVMGVLAVTVLLAQRPHF